MDGLGSFVKKWERELHLDARRGRVCVFGLLRPFESPEGIDFVHQKAPGPEVVAAAWSACHNKVHDLGASLFSGDDCGDNVVDKLLVIGPPG
eukprot:scaffold1784_cov21-Tisochrysis_lutea.AAC.2